jgi:alcohol dehydrogenase (NADP+)
MYDPLAYHGATKKKGMTIGVVGIGGLGSIGVKLAKALGHTVVGISTAHEEEIAYQRGADHFICSTDKDMMEKNKMSIDLILNTIPAAHQVMDYMNLLNFNGTIVQIGLVPEAHQVTQLPILRYRWTLTGSHIGGIKATEEVLDLCAEHKILPEVELVQANQLDWVWDQLHHNNSGLRYVLDIKKSLANKDFLP